MDSKNDHVRKGWTDDITQWKRFYKDIYKYSWAGIEFQRNKANVIPKKPGIYIVEAKMPKGYFFRQFEEQREKVCDERLPFKNLKSVVYVGQSKDLRKRFKNYVSGKDDNRFQKYFQGLNNLQFFWTYHKDFKEQVRRDYIEDLLIEVFGPTLNKKREINKKTRAIIDIASSGLHRED